ncbi:MAG: hypothetical protein COB77_05060, partial [Gammaproteobacteria bacterium]
MQKQNFTLVYFIAWLLTGIILGSIILLYRGDINLTFAQSQPQQTNSTDNPTDVQHNYRGFADAVMKAAPAVVSIQTILWSEPSINNDEDEIIIQRFLSKNSPHRPKRKAEIGSGSGVIINADGYILTNYHVISKRDEIRVRLNDGQVAKAELIGSDPDTDLAVLKINFENLPALNIADTNRL